MVQVCNALLADTVLMERLASFATLNAAETPRSDMEWVAVKAGELFHRLCLPPETEPGHRGNMKMRYLVKRSAPQRLTLGTFGSF